jgi:Zn-finger nucleic acid-binding protein
VTGSLNCPSCGAPAAADATRCEYCASALKPVTCPSCFAPMFAGAQFCPHCGAKASAAVEDSGEPLPCPTCSEPMKPVRVGSTPMQQCAGCGGSWLTTDVFTALCTDREAQQAMSSTFALDAGATKAPAVRLGDVRYRRCPGCQKLMNRVNFGRVSGVVIDLCKGHGVWFDPGELQRVLAFVAGGGLERMRESEAEFKELSKKAWATPDFALGDPHAPHSGSSTNLTIRITSNTDDAAITRRMLQFLLT